MSGGSLDNCDWDMENGEVDKVRRYLDLAMQILDDAMNHRDEEWFFGGEYRKPTAQEHELISCGLDVLKTKLDAFKAQIESVGETAKELASLFHTFDRIPSGDDGLGAVHAHALKVAKVGWKAATR